jgi:Prenyltransferase and squalene oxidase repeat
MCAVSSELGPARRSGLPASLELVLPSLPPELAGGQAIPWLRAVAGVLPPIHRAGFECRLDGDDPVVDLQQGVFAADREPERLARFLAAAEPLSDAWRAVRRLAERWAAPGDPLHGPVSEVWLELDAPGPRDGSPLSLADASPSVFALLDGGGAAGEEAAGEFLRAVLGEDGAAAHTSAVARCARACPAPAGITHAGAMLGRPFAAIRLHVSRVPLGGLEGLLAGVGWEPQPGPALSAAALLLDYGDSVIVCLDILAGRVVRVGLECFFDQKHGLDRRWPALLERLVASGLCSRAKAQALLRWPGTLTPLDSPGPWPDDLIVASLSRPEESFGVIDRRLSHVKLTVTPGLPLAAKAYFGFGNVWTAPRDSAAAAERGPVPPPASRPAPRPAPDAAAAIDAAVSQLLGARGQAGWWRDFFNRARPPGAERLVTGGSDEWVSAYVAAALLASGQPRARAAAGEALELLLRRPRPGPGWGYHLLLPADADTTAWVLRLARALGAPAHERLQAGRAFLAKRIDADGAVCTYDASATAQLERWVEAPGSYDGWCTAHTCVTAAAAVLDLDGPARYLPRAQNADGSWTGYWWDDDEYATCRAVEALAPRGGTGAAVARGVAWSAGRIGGDGAVQSAAHAGPSPFATALALHTLRLGAGTAPPGAGTGPHGAARRRHGAGTPPLDPAAAAAADRAERWLLANQLADGSWEPSARLRIPAPAPAAAQPAWTYVDEDGLFTSATVLAALCAGACSRA